VRIFRQLSTRRLLALLVAVAALAVGASMAAVAATGSSAPTPPAKPLDQAIHDALTAKAPAGVTARVTFTNNLFPSGAFEGIGGIGGSALVTGASGRLWWSPDGGRIELQSDSGDAQILWDKQTVQVWDSSANTVYRFSLPQHSQDSSSSTDTGTDTGPTLADIDSFLKRIADEANVGDAVPVDVANRPAYRVTVSPAHSAGLIGDLQLAWDAEQGVPLEIALYASGHSAPALALEVTDISFGAVSASDLSVSPPASAKVVDLGTPGRSGSDQGAGTQQHVSGLAAVQAQVPFTIVAPETLVGLPRRSVQLLGGEKKGALVLYGHGLGGILVVERAADQQQSGGGHGSQLPTVSLGSTSAQELPTELGTVLTFEQNGVGFVLAGSLPASAAEAAARSLLG
jgi:outer membrane lipoprotein-sorting protein